MVVTQGIYIFYGYRFSPLEVDSQVNARSVGRYNLLFSFFEDILQVVVFLRDHVAHVLVFVVLLVFYHQFGANVDSFQLNFIFDFIPS